MCIYSRVYRILLLYSLVQYTTVGQTESDEKPTSDPPVFALDRLVGGSVLHFGVVINVKEKGIFPLQSYSKRARKSPAIKLQG